MTKKRKRSKDSRNRKSNCSNKPEDNESTEDERLQELTSTVSLDNLTSPIVEDLKSGCGKRLTAKKAEKKHVKKTNKGRACGGYGSEGMKEVQTPKSINLNALTSTISLDALTKAFLKNKTSGSDVGCGKRSNYKSSKKRKARSYEEESEDDESMGDVALGSSFDQNGVPVKLFRYRKNKFRERSAGNYDEKMEEGEDSVEGIVENNEEDRMKLSDESGNAGVNKISSTTVDKNDYEIGMYRYRVTPAVASTQFDEDYIDRLVEDINRIRGSEENSKDEVRESARSLGRSASLASVGKLKNANNSHESVTKILKLQKVNRKVKSLNEYADESGVNMAVDPDNVEELLERMSNYSDMDGNSDDEEEESFASASPDALTIDIAELEKLKQVKDEPPQGYYDEVTRNAKSCGEGEEIGSDLVASVDKSLLTTDNIINLIKVVGVNGKHEDHGCNLNAENNGNHNEINLLYQMNDNSQNIPFVKSDLHLGKKCDEDDICEYEDRTTEDELSANDNVKKRSAENKNTQHNINKRECSTTQSFKNFICSILCRIQYSEDSLQKSLCTLQEVDQYLNETLCNINSEDREVRQERKTEATATPAPLTMITPLGEFLKKIPMIKEGKFGTEMTSNSLTTESLKAAEPGCETLQTKDLSTSKRSKIFVKNQKELEASGFNYYISVDIPPETSVPSNLLKLAEPLKTLTSPATIKECNPTMERSPFVLPFIETISSNSYNDVSLSPLSAFKKRALAKRKIVQLKHISKKFAHKPRPNAQTTILPQLKLNKNGLYSSQAPVSAIKRKSDFVQAAEDEVSLHARKKISQHKGIQTQRIAPKSADSNLVEETLEASNLEELNSNKESLEPERMDSNKKTLEKSGSNKENLEESNSNEMVQRLKRDLDVADELQNELNRLKENSYIKANEIRGTGRNILNVIGNEESATEKITNISKKKRFLFSLLKKKKKRRKKKNKLKKFLGLDRETNFLNQDYQNSP